MQLPQQEANQTSSPSTASDLHLIDVKVLITIVYLVIFLVGVIGNICNCLVIADTRNKYMKTATNYYLFSLSVSDLLLLVFGLPHDIVDIWHPSYLFNQFVCISRGWISEASTNASVLVIVAFTVERYLAICHPLRAHTLSRLSRSVKVIILIWLLASSCALVVVLQYGVINVADEHQAIGQSESMFKAQCTLLSHNERIFEFSVLIFFILPMAIITILYVRLGYHLRHKSLLSKQSQNDRRQLGTDLRDGRGRLALSQSVSQMARLHCESQPAKEEMALAEDPRAENLSSSETCCEKFQLPARSQSMTNEPNLEHRHLLILKTLHYLPNKSLEASGAPILTSKNTPSSGIKLDLVSELTENLDRPTSSSEVGKLNESTSFISRKLYPQHEPNGYSQSLDTSKCVTSLSVKHHQHKPIALNSTVNAANMQSVIKMLVSVVVMFFICWAPFHAQRLMAVYVVEPTREQELIFNLLNHVSGISYYVSAVVNPILYSLFSVKFRQAFRDTFGSTLLVRICPIKKPVHRGESSAEHTINHQLCANQLTL